MTGALYTDLYELNMASSYLRRGMTQPGTFSLFVRRLPSSRGFLVATGLQECLDFLETFRFEDDDLAYLQDELAFDDVTLDAFARVRFTGDVWAVPEGRIVHAGEPLLEVTAPIAEAQLVETVLLNLVTFDTTVASKAARCRIAASGKDLVDFSFRRTQGVDAAMAVARSSAIVGFVATSNVEAARRYGLAAAGTMAHSYVEAFPTEADAFRAFAQDFPSRTTFLVDTFDTEEGIRTVIAVIRELGLTDRLGIRLDSGDLEALARRARGMLDDAGLPGVGIFASGGLDELAIDDLVRAGAPIDAFGVGTRMGVSADAPFLDTAYKLVEFDGRPVLKLSPQKVSAPGAKQVFRSSGGVDVIGLRDEAPPPGAEPLLRPVMAGGRRTEPAPSPREAIDAARAVFEFDLEGLPTGAANLRDPRPVEPATSSSLAQLAERTRSLALRGAAQRTTATD
jgi:nicotinate phosphoribosyltransferase